MLKKTFRRILRFYKTQTIIFIFLALITFGAILLNTPAASRSGQSIGFLNAFFTATSATCVTGLIVADTYQHWSLFGQVVILVLIQTGGLGFMTMATLFSLVLKRTISLSERLLISESLNYDNMSGIVRLAKHIIIGTAAAEAVGAALLSIRFIPEFGIKSGIYKSVFHSISAFCNAGFDIMGEKQPFGSLTQYVFDPIVVFTISGLIIMGGIGFFVWEDIYSGRKKLKLHTKIAIIITCALLAGGTLGFYLLEGNNPGTFLGMNWYQKFLAAFFQSVSPRTAGFNTIALNELTPSSKLLTVILMFIGGSPGSTAGGIKTVTFGVAVFTAFAVAKGSDRVSIFGRRISNSVIYRSFTIIMIAMLVVMLGIIALSLTEYASLSDIVFEVFSAFGTVGSTLGLTPHLTNAGKVIIIIIMFFGRVGVLTIALGLLKRMNNGVEDKIRYPEEKIMVG